ncbi:UNVERIFIED_CONTAM: hypothetical protein GTU68_028254 [Idotea baltica]|nr:hypothetical protein [Idotea baltica]
MGIRSIAVYSEVDRNAPFVQEADMAVFIGGSDPTESYLNQEKIIASAKKIGADAIHPGYGFLSENADFARSCEQEGFIFIGPNPAAIDAMGSKAKAKELMKKHEVPIVPGYQGEDQSLETLRNAAIEIGFPVLLKATAGGGGKGMRIVYEEAKIETAIEAAQRESKRAFGDDRLIVEKYISSGRHIEFQIFGDQQGNIIHLLERECTIQRRYQKVIEESPSPIMTTELRTKMGEAAVKAAKALNYDNAGTVEFIYDDQSGKFYFLEVNTRLQVEHPVTEAITGLDLVQMQIESAQGIPLSLQQEELSGKGYAIECRLYAEDPANDFLPVTGIVHQFNVPKVEGLRVDSAIQSGSKISVFYDPMIAKLIVWAPNRQTAHQKMQYVLRQLVCLGTTTNQGFLQQLIANKEFQEGKYDTHFIDKKIDLSAIFPSQESQAFAGIAGTLCGWQKRENQRILLRSVSSGWRNSFYEHQQEIFLIGEKELLVKYRFQSDHFQFIIEENSYSVCIISNSKNYLRVEIDGIQYGFTIVQNAANYFIHQEQIGNVHLTQKDRFPTKEVTKVKGGYIAPMPSQVIKVLVEPGQKVVSGEGLIVLSSMKMENTLEALEDGIVEEVFAAEGTNVEAGFLLLKLKEV